MRVRCANPAGSLTQHQHYHRLSAAALNSGRNRNFVHRKASLASRRPRVRERRRSPSVRASSLARRGPAVAGAGEGSCRPGGGCDPRSGDAGHNCAAGGRWTGDAVPMTKPETEASRCIFCKIALVMAPLAAGVVASPGPSRESRGGSGRSNRRLSQERKPVPSGLRPPSGRGPCANRIGTDQTVFVVISI